MKKVLICLAIIFICGFSLFAEPAMYNPNGRMEYIFADLDSEYGYLAFEAFNSLSESKGFNHIKLPVKDYRFKKVYIESTLEVDSNYSYYAIVIETGEKYVYKCYKSIEKTPIPGFRKYSDYLLFQTRINTNEAMFLGSNAIVTGGKFGAYGDEYSFNNGITLSATLWGKILSIIDYLKADTQKNEIIANLLTKKGLAIQVDNFDEIAFIKVASIMEGDLMNTKFIYPPLQLYIGIQNGKVWGRLKAEYQSRDWLFSNSLTIGADGKKWDSGTVTFERETTKNGITEIMDIPATDSMISFMKEFCDSTDRRIRFRGESKYADKIPEEQFIIAQSTILDLYHTMTK
ncbi:MAG: hypothetical protein RBR15_16875 [Sphaerochaeta sp.]|nr:hypothetical protein [Sphaerochaeta sp.]